jgi:hypothetical protein
MKFHGSWLLWMAAFPLSAGTIDASRVATARLQPGDSLVFAIPSWNYTGDAATYGLPPYPSGVSFTLISAASMAPASFEASLQSADGSFSVRLAAPLTFGPGSLTSNAYTGAVSALEGGFQLTSGISQQIFGGVGAELRLQNLGPAVTLGLPQITLPEDLFVSLSGGPLAVGALHGAVVLLQSAAEPDSGTFLLVGGVLLCLISRTCIRPPKNVKSTVCNPVGHSDTI